MTTATASSALCKCGHDRDAHEHFRAGSDCGSCADASCAKFRRNWFSHRPAPLHILSDRTHATPAAQDVIHPEAA